MIFTIGGAIGGLLTVLFMNLGIIIFTSLLGSMLILKTVELNNLSHTYTYLILAGLGIYFQSIKEEELE